MKKNNINISLHKLAFTVFIPGAALLFTPAFRHSFYSPKILLGALFLIYLIYTAGPEKIFSSELFRPAAAFLFIAALTLVLRGRFAFGGGNYAAMVVVFLLLLAVSAIPSGELKGVVRNTLAVSLFLVSVYAIIQHYGIAGQFEKFAYESSIMPISTLGNRVYLADYILLAMPFAVVVFKNNLLKGAPVLAAALWALYLSGALRALPGVMAILAVFIYYSKSRERIIYAAFCGAAVLVALGLLYSNPRRVFEKHLRPRLQVWRISRDMFYSSPVLGLGAGTFAYHYPLYQEKFFRDESNLPHARDSQRTLPLRAQSEPVHILTETGLVGLILIVWLFYLWFKKAEKDMDFGVPALAGAWALVLSSLIGFPFHRPETVLTLAVIMGVAAEPKKAGAGYPEITGWLKGILIALGLFMVFLKSGEQVLWEKGRRAFEKGEYEEAVDYLETAEDFSHLPGELLHLRGRAWYRKGDYREAREDYIRAMKTYRHSALYNNLAAVFIRMGKYEKAEAYFKKAIYTTPKFENPYRILINLHVRTSRPQSAIKYENMLRAIKGQE